MLAANVIIKLSSRIPTDREEENDESKLSAIWAKRVLRILAACVTEQQELRARWVWTQGREGPGKASLEQAAPTSALKWSPVTTAALRTDPSFHSTGGISVSVYCEEGNQDFQEVEIQQPLIGSHPVKYGKLGSFYSTSV